VFFYQIGLELALQAEVNFHEMKKKKEKRVSVFSSCVKLLIKALWVGIVFKSWVGLFKS
jgi:hypothetical protein